MRASAHQGRWHPECSVVSRGAGAPMLAGASRSTPLRRGSTRPAWCSSHRAGRSFRTPRNTPDGRSRAGRCVLSRVPLRAGRSPQKAAQRPPVPVVSAVSGHLGRRYLGSQPAGAPHRAVTQGHRVRPIIGTSPVLVGRTVARKCIASTTTPTRRHSFRRRPTSQWGGAASRPRAGWRPPWPLWDNRRTSPSPLVVASRWDTVAAVFRRTSICRPSCSHTPSPRDTSGSPIHHLSPP
jgi:hypothetical protein